MSSDTVRGCWKCMLIDLEMREMAADELINVSVHDLAGVEDIMKRKVLFQYLPASASATELADDTKAT